MISKKQKAEYVVACLTVFIWAIPACIYALYHIGTGKDPLAVMN